jgi:hypothetical protein
MQSFLLSTISLPNFFTSSALAAIAKSIIAGSGSRTISTAILGIGSTIAPSQQKGMGEQHLLSHYSCGSCLFAFSQLLAVTCITI